MSAPRGSVVAATGSTCMRSRPSGWLSAESLALSYIRPLQLLAVDNRAIHDDREWFRLANPVPINLEQVLV